MSNAKVKVEKFIGKSNFSLWKLKVRDLLMQQGLHKALDGATKRPATMTDSNWEDLDARALSTIRLCLADEVLFNIVEESTTSVVGALLFEEVRRKSSTETATSEALIARGQSGKRRKINTVRTLTSVRHVPDLKKNLISLGVLDLDGYKFTGKNGVLKVFKGALIVMKAEKVGNIYRLKGSTQVSKVAVASEKEEADTRLWHQRLGHMNKKGLQILMKRKSLPDLKSLKLDFYKHCVYGK
eukprot:PITA_17110